MGERILLSKLPLYQASKLLGFFSSTYISLGIIEYAGAFTDGGREAATKMHTRATQNILKHAQTNFGRRQCLSADRGTMAESVAPAKNLRTLAIVL